ncbi:TlpA disulfide reductase family protein [Alkalimarinus sediminis]|uniref:Redoxin family protein n=1 Tax=Alkalimarinus sediminis TaxID=1632866 RepID=A0A9E8KP84_9ALTE|nr:TlpA disulfide reductase family protein [Alkalimarinus sediminis]UZW75158.1 redoxin family protein [Alkalimarinus sediminis]
MSVAVGPFALSWGHILFFVAYFIALFVGWRVGRRNNVSVEPVLTRMLIVGLIVARAVFVVSYWGEYSADLLGILDLRDGGFSLFGGVAGSLLVAVYYLWRKPAMRIALTSAMSAAVAVWLTSVVVYDTIRASQVLPDQQYQTLAAEPVMLSKFNDKPIVINLWATWCPPCRREMPVFMQAQQQRSDVNFVFINQGEYGYSVANYLQSEQLSLFNMLLDPKQLTMRQLGAQGLPSTLFYTADGVLAHSHMGELSEASLNHALKKIAPR